MRGRRRLLRRGPGLGVVEVVRGSAVRAAPGSVRGTRPDRVALPPSRALQQEAPRLSSPLVPSPLVGLIQATPRERERLRRESRRTTTRARGPHPASLCRPAPAYQRHCVNGAAPCCRKAPGVASPPARRRHASRRGGARLSLRRGRRRGQGHAYQEVGPAARGPPRAQPLHAPQRLGDSCPRNAPQRSRAGRQALHRRGQRRRTWGSRKPRESSREVDEARSRYRTRTAPGTDARQSSLPRRTQASLRPAPPRSRCWR